MPIDAYLAQIRQICPELDFDSEKRLAGKVFTQAK